MLPLWLIVNPDTVTVLPLATLVSANAPVAPAVLSVTVSPEITPLSAALPVLDSAIAWAALVVPTFWFANVKEAGDRLTEEEVEISA